MSAEESMIDKKLIRRAAMLLCVAAQGTYGEKADMLRASAPAAMEVLNADPSAVAGVERELQRMIRGC